jgi:glycosyltransferase involved in cell wall biosynthesis
VRILLVDQFADLGGAQQCFLDLLPALTAAGWSVTAALPGSGPYAERLRAADVRVEEFQMGNYSNGAKGFAERVRFAVEAPAVARALGRIAEDIRPDLIYVNGPRLLPAAVLAGRKRAPLLFHCHNHLPQASAAQAAARALRWSGARVVSCCMHAVAPLRTALEPGQIEIVYNGVPGPGDGREGSRPGKPGGLRHEGDRRFTFGLVGRISPEKGQRHFFEAAVELDRSIPGLRYVLCGDVLFGDAAAQAYRDQLPADSPVQRLGWRADAGDVIAGLDVLVVPSVREPATPRVILEAYARGAPVIAYATGGIAEIVEHGKTGLLLPEPDARALAAAMRELASSPPERLAELGENGRRLWRERFHVDRYRREMIAAMLRAVEAPVRV